MLKKISGIIIISFLVFSCHNKKTDEKKPETEKSLVLDEDMKKNGQEKPFEPEKRFYFDFEYKPISEEEYKRLSKILYGNEERHTEGWVERILFTLKVNFAVPGGDNYIVLWEGVKRGSFAIDELILYSISDKIENRYYINTGLPISVGTNFDIMKDIPGFIIGGTTGASVFDCNGDRIDELFLYGFYGMGYFVQIKGYDAEKNEIVDYCDYLEFEIIDKDLGPAPVEFTYYENRNGFKVFKRYDSNIPPVNLIDNLYAWYFYAWNNETRKFENNGEYLQELTNEKYDVHAHSIEHFKNRITIEHITGGMEQITDIEEVIANKRGGRSFNIVIEDHTGDVYKRTIDFDSDGIFVNNRVNKSY
jgi:hypothetical protein